MMQKVLFGLDVGGALVALLSMGATLSGQFEVGAIVSFIGIGASLAARAIRAFILGDTAHILTPPPR